MKRRAFKGVLLAAIACTGWTITSQSATARIAMIRPMQPTTSSATLPRDRVPTGNAEADRAWNEGSYAIALKLYQEVLARQTLVAVDEQIHNEIEYRVAVSLGKTEQWDKAIAAGEALIAKKTQQTARTLYWLGRLYTVVPHQGYQVGDRVYRGEDYPKIAGAEKPQMISTDQSDAEKTLSLFEQAKLQAQADRDFMMVARFAKAPRFLSTAEENDLNFDLAAWLPRMQFDDFIKDLEAGKNTGANVDVNAAYNTQWNLPTKVLYLYNQIRVLDNNTTEQSPLSLFAKGLFLRAYIQRMDGWANKYDVVQKKYIKRPYPFDQLDAIVVWEQLVREFPRTATADKTLITIAQTWEQRNDMVKALAAYRRVLAMFPKSKWASDARAHIQQITKREVSMYSPVVQKPGVAATFNITTRNLKDVRFTAYKVKLENVVAQASKLNQGDTHFTQFDQNFGAIDAAQKAAGAPVAQWDFKAEDLGDYHQVTAGVASPLKDLGAYLVVAQSGGVRAAQIIVISDLMLLKKTDRDGAFLYVADAQSGRPIAGANVILKETYYQDSANKSNWTKGQSDAQGFYDKKSVISAGIYNTQTEGFAWMGDRYALTGQGYSSYYSDNRDEMKIYSYTDRPVYRPAQKVYFRQILTQRVAGAKANSETVGDQQPAKNVKVDITVYNPKGETIFTKTLTTSEFGTINGDFDLPEGAPLGEYSISANVPQTNQNVAASGSNRFRVEEYKRPEFQVTVDAPDNAVRVGETVAAKINAKYYFGSPVPNATVKYTVRRSTWWANYRFPTPYDWLWAYWGTGDYDTGRRNIGGEGAGTIVKEGTVKTDAQGNAEVNFTATDDKTPETNVNDWWRRYQNPLYTIEAQVTDASRRTIEGQGEVRLAKQQYFAFLNTKGGFFQQGDRVPVEIRIQDANDKPQAANGKMVVYKQLPGDKEDRVLEAPISIDKSGAAFWTWNSDQSGQFRIAYEATDAWGNKVETSTVVWIAGPELNTTQFRLQGVTIVLDKRSYEEGETLRALVVADQPGTTILWTQEAGGDILKRQLIHISGKSQVIEIPIEHKHVPNFSLAAALVKNYEVYQAQEEVFVPPVQQLINVSVKGDKDVYKPGESGTFKVTATDWKGRPARAEVSMALIDASLFYIQKNYAPDVRTFYYGQRRANSVNLDSSRSGQLQGRLEDNNSYGKYEQHGWELPDGLGQLNLDPAGWGWYGYYGGRGNFANGAVFASRSRVAGGMMAEDSAMPMSAPAASSSVSGRVLMDGDNSFSNSLSKAKSSLRDDASSTGLVAAQTRSNFAETAFWAPAVVTDGGSATVKVTFPDSLTEWHATARGLTEKTQVGSGESDVETKKNLLVRLQSPRFFTQRDQVVLSANVHNYLKTDKRVKVSLNLGGGEGGDLLQTSSGTAMVNGVGKPVRASTTTASDSTFVVVKAGEEARIDWRVNVLRDGLSKIKMTAQSDQESDAVEMSFPVVVHGVQRFANQSGVLKDGNKTVIDINIPKERRFGASTLNVQLNPSLAATMLDALPYLADYPYGCVEQTVSRFLPTVVAERTLKESGVNLETLRARAQAYKAESSTRPLGERIKNTGYTYPTGMPNSRDLTQMASQMWFVGRGHNPIYDKTTMDKMTNEGLQRLYGMQRSDGGWGWWPGSATSDEYMTAYVVYGLATAKAAGVDIRDNVLNHGYQFLEEHIKTEENLHLLTYMAFSLSQRGAYSDATQGIIGGRVYDQRERLTAYSKALLALTLQNTGQPDKAQVLIRNLENTAKIDEENGTVRYKTGSDWWNWWNNDIETTAFVLRAFLRIEPKNRLTPMLAKWLVTNARGNHWRSTKETAEVVYALSDYVRVNKELDVDYSLKVNLNGRVARTYRVNRDNALFFDNRFIAGDLFLQDGANNVTIEKVGRGTLYWSAASEYFSLEEPIQASGNEIGIQRRYFKLSRNPKVQAEQGGNLGPNPIDREEDTSKSSTRIVPFPPRDVTPKEPEFLRTELKDGDALKSGDLVEVELTLTSKNDYSYLVFEDMKAAGFEPVDVRSGQSYGDGLSSNVELRDEKVAFFVDNLPQGTRVLRYQVRSEIPGSFHALPTNGYAMYAPEVRAISDEARFNVSD
jgi:uncharacterized protein YfaS (alpha-2-macroglobulin family)/TolA-binding protein